MTGSLKFKHFLVGRYIFIVKNGPLDVYSLSKNNINNIKIIIIFNNRTQLHKLNYHIYYMRFSVNVSVIQVVYSVYRTIPPGSTPLQMLWCSGPAYHDERYGLLNYISKSLDIFNIDVEGILSHSSCKFF